MPAPGHAAAAADFDVIAARERHLAGLLLLVQPPRHVHVHAADAVFILRRQVLQDRQEPADCGPTVSMMYLPTRPVEFAMPFGNWLLFELSMMRAVSQQLAASTTILP